MGLQWYCAETKPFQMEQAAANLQAQHFTVCHPVYLVNRVVRGVRKEFERPLFPGYVLTEFDVDLEGWQAVNYTRGIKRLMCGASELPLAIRPKVMKELLARTALGPMQDVSWLVKFRVGQQVKVNEGPLADHVGKCTRVDRERVWLLLSFLGSQREIEFKAKDLEMAA